MIVIGRQPASSNTVSLQSTGWSNLVAEVEPDGSARTASSESFSPGPFREPSASPTRCWGSTVAVALRTRTD